MLWGALGVLCGVCMVCRGVRVCMVCCVWCTVGTHKKMASVRSEHKARCPRYSTKLSVTQEAPVQDWYTSAIRKTMKWTCLSLLGGHIDCSDQLFTSYLASFSTPLVYL